MIILTAILCLLILLNHISEYPFSFMQSQILFLYL